MACEFDTHFKVFHELMSNKVLEILLVANAYDAFILEEDGSLAAKIINEYRGLNLSRPPRLTRVDNARAALTALQETGCDLVIIMPQWDDMDPFDFGAAIKALKPNLPVIILAHSVVGLHPLPDNKDTAGIDRIFIWTGDADLLLAIVKSVEDRLNAAADTRRAQVRVLLLVEDSPLYLSQFLPLMYKEVVHQIQAVLEESLNESHRLLKMRARPRILVAETYEQALDYLAQYGSYLLGVVADTRFPSSGKLCNDAGARLLLEIKGRIPDLPTLLLSSDPANRIKAEQLAVPFLDKNSPHLFDKLHGFFLDHLGFGDFVFRRPDGSEVVRVPDLHGLEAVLPSVPDEPLRYHAARNRFSNWLMARSEIAFASQLRQVKVSDFPDTAALRAYLIDGIKALRRWRQKGVVIQFNAETFDPATTDFAKIGNGSLGGKARGLAFAASLLRQSHDLFKRFPGIDIRVPATLVIATDRFEHFVADNGLADLPVGRLSDEDIQTAFLSADLPAELERELAAFVNAVRYPLAVRSSSLLEDARHQSLGGLYCSLMLPNQHPDAAQRLKQLVRAVKQVYASAWLTLPRRMTRGTVYAHRREQMAVMIQRIEGRAYGPFFYPAVSGVARSQNYYPFGSISPNDGMAVILLGFSRESGVGLRFCPRFPQLLPSFSSVEDILTNAQRTFFAIDLNHARKTTDPFDTSIWVRRNLADATQEIPVKQLSSVYLPDEQRFRDASGESGPRVLTFSAILKHDHFPLAPLVAELLALGRREMGCDMELEFALALDERAGRPARFSILQLRPMASAGDPLEVALSARDRTEALLYSNNALGHGRWKHIRDIVYARPEAVDASRTMDMAAELARINARLKSEQRPYVLIGPGRWGTFDPWLGIPVKWQQIDGVAVMVELRSQALKADPSFGSHFFHQITSHGIAYLTIVESSRDRIDWQRLNQLPAESDGAFFRQVRCDHPLLIKCDGRGSECAVLTDRHASRFG
ncbi:MAG: phosphoenolpyruvate synthase/pyruvate phosphate dikinase [Desulfatitalea sp.]|nr:phosphoenolpyruvate synthase/pyruvate phosphate dikinase [Desulfatitalea sp.]NNK01481.1 phosphoenolpyruvate synthase/pyruvate phosphate dikinase [Desulfatitalea sp.]